MCRIKLPVTSATCWPVTGDYVKNQGAREGGVKGRRTGGGGGRKGRRRGRGGRRRGRGDHEAEESHLVEMNSTGGWVYLTTAQVSHV